jgi:hypothetical protein
MATTLLDYKSSSDFSANVEEAKVRIKRLILDDLDAIAEVLALHSFVPLVYYKEELGIQSPTRYWVGDEHEVNSGEILL